MKIEQRIANAKAELEAAERELAKSKEWPQEGDTYHYVYISYGNAKVEENHWDNDLIDDAHRKSGNFYRTKEEAQYKVDIVNEVLKGTPVILGTNCSATEQGQEVESQ